MEFKYTVLLPPFPLGTLPPFRCSLRLEISLQWFLVYRRFWNEYFTPRDVSCRQTRQPPRLSNTTVSFNNSERSIETSWSAFTPLTYECLDANKQQNAIYYILRL